MKNSKAVGPALGLTPILNQSGESDSIGRISQCGDGMTRTLAFTKPLKTPKGRKNLRDFRATPYVVGMITILSVLPLVPVTRPYLASELQKIQKSAIIHDSFGVIWGMLAKETCHANEQARHRANAARGGDIAA